MSPASPSKSSSVRPVTSPRDLSCVHTWLYDYLLIDISTLRWEVQMSSLLSETQPSRGLRAGAHLSQQSPLPLHSCAGALAPPGEQGWD